MSQQIQTTAAQPVTINPAPQQDNNDYEHAKFGVLQRQIFSRQDLDEFKQSESYSQWLQFINDLTESVKGLPCSIECHISEVRMNHYCPSPSVSSSHPSDPARAARDRHAARTQAMDR